MTTLGFTLVELLAVIVILAIILVIAVPKVMDIINDAKKGTLESTAKMIASQAEKQKVQNTLLGKSDDEITCKSVAKINDVDYKSCVIKFEDDTAKVTIEGAGKFNNLWVCDGTKTGAVAQKEVCELNCGENETLVEVTNVTKPYVIKDKASCIIVATEIANKASFSEEEYAIIEPLCSGQTIGGMTLDDAITSFIASGLTTEKELIERNAVEGTIKKECHKLKGLNCTYNGQLVKGTEFVHNQYTYRYKEVNLSGEISDMQEDGWSVTLTSKGSITPVNTPICSYINGKPIVSTAYMFALSNATSIDLSGFDVSNVTDMNMMFGGSGATKINLSGLDARKVKNMSGMFTSTYNLETLNLTNFITRDVIDMSAMFAGSKADLVDLSSFDTQNLTNMSYMFEEASISNVIFGNFNTSNVTNMNNMFWMMGTTTLDLSSFDTSNVKTMSGMFGSTNIKELDLSNFNTINVTNMSSMFYSCYATSINLSSFDTRNVTSMNNMFYGTKVTSLDLSSFDTNNVTNMDWMFTGSTATTGYARTQADADKFNASSDKPSTLTFVVK